MGEDTGEVDTGEDTGEVDTGEVDMGADTVVEAVVEAVQGLAQESDHRDIRLRTINLLVQTEASPTPSNEGYPPPGRHVRKSPSHVGRA